MEHFLMDRAISPKDGRRLYSTKSFKAAISGVCQSETDS
jgi:hypothetical protein